MVIKITLIGTEGQLDKPEVAYGVRHLKDSLTAARFQALKLEEKYRRYGWTYIIADKELEMEYCENCAAEKKGKCQDVKAAGCNMPVCPNDSCCFWMPKRKEGKAC